MPDESKPDQKYCCMKSEFNEHCQMSDIGYCTLDLDHDSHTSSNFMLCPNPEDCGKTDFVLKNRDVTKIELNSMLNFRFCKIKISNEVEGSSKIRVKNPNFKDVDVFIYRGSYSDRKMIKEDKFNRKHEITLEEGQDLYLIGISQANLASMSFEAEALGGRKTEDINEEIKLEVSS
mmetsp:Transcript_2177/g.2511  ORF Transcript_2177/g.2511 Transcript_2177/m.2511 type:complete len:176 (-) Transcript_2177:61-588(-)